MRIKYILLVVFSIFIVLLVSKFRPRTLETSDNLQVVASIYPLSFFASEIGGDKVDVRTITPSGVEPHEYNATVRDMVSIEKADVVIINGALESWQGSNVSTIVAGDGLITKNDPHIWLDPILAKQVAHVIASAFMKFDTQNSEYYKQNEKKLDNLLDQLDQAYTVGLRQCELKDFITSHTAFGYLATRYHLQQVSIAGLSPDTEPSAKQLIDIANFAKDHKVKYIFFEKLASPKLSQTIATEIGAQTLVLDPIEGLSDDDRKAGKNYLSIMRENLQNLQTAMLCKQ